MRAHAAQATSADTGSLLLQDALKKTHGEESSDLHSECAQLLEENKKDDVLKKLVTASAVLNSAPEKGEHGVRNNKEPGS